MNNVCISGNLTKDPEVRYTTGEKATAMLRFNIGVRREFKNANGDTESDFPSIVAWGRTAEFIQKYFHKGDRIEVIGQIRTGSYTNKDGQKVYTTEVYADKVGFGGGKSNGGGEMPVSTQKHPVSNEDFMNVPDGIDDELPFA